LKRFNIKNNANKNESEQVSTGGKGVINFKNETGLPVKLAVQTALVHEKDKGNAGMSFEQLNEYLIGRSGEICEYVRKRREGCHTSDIIPPLCYKENTLNQNIDSVLACFSNTLSAALFFESDNLKLLKNFKCLSSIVESEKYLIFGFLTENGLTEKFNEYVKNKN
jgi:hypothetical protein